MLGRFARSTVSASFRHSRAMSTIPVDHVARVVRMHVADEEAAMKADSLFQQGLDLFKNENPSGFVEARRTVCKAEWAYEVEVVFEVDHFKDYMESEFREKKVNPILSQMVELNTTDSTYSGNRVFNKYTL
jgi:hypothetical protein